MALAAMALAFVLLRPVCELWFGHANLGGAAFGTASVPGADHQAQCCSSVSDGNLTASLTAALGGAERSPGFAAAAPLAFVFGIPVLARQLHSLRAPPPGPSSYYLRSARILR